MVGLSREGTLSIHALRCMCGGAWLTGSSPPFLGRKRAAVDVDVGPERRSPRYHETCLALAGVEESSATVLEPRSLRW